MVDEALRARLDAAIDLLDDGQRQRLLDWAGSMNRSVERARAPGASIGPIAEALHITNEGAADGRATYALDAVPELLNPHGVLHGGAVYTMVDYSMGGATMSVLPPGEICATIEIKISYFTGVRGGRLTCDTQIVRRGRSVVFLESRVADAAGVPVAAATGSFAVVRRAAP
ncbi:MAG TPA: PaaI family thioesterase [Dehalococcoidia bacterium]|nr:PaaI family thioesterase [Dehalococcoidia bacterium]